MNLKNEIMRSFIFVQWKNPTDASRFVIDGKVSEYSGTDSQDKIMKLFAEVPKYKEIFSNNNNAKFSPSFRCSYLKTRDSILNCIEGNFEETDCSGRKLVFIFATFENESSQISQILREYAGLLGVTPHTEDLEEIEKIKFKKKTSNKKILCVSILIAILLLLFMLLNHLSKL